MVGHTAFVGSRCQAHRGPDLLLLLLLRVAGPNEFEPATRHRLDTALLRL